MVSLSLSLVNQLDGVTSTDNAAVCKSIRRQLNGLWKDVVLVRRSCATAVILLIVVNKYVLSVILLTLVILKLVLATYKTMALELLSTASLLAATYRSAGLRSHHRTDCRRRNPQSRREFAAPWGPSDLGRKTDESKLKGRLEVGLILYVTPYARRRLPCCKRQTSHHSK